jgi:inorganic pyrophosphatase
VIGQVPVTPGVVIRSRPIGVLIMEDEVGTDENILCVPADDLHPYYANIGSYQELPEILREQDAHFFSHYKDLEAGKLVKVKRWGEPDEALELIRQGVQRASEGQAG